MEKLRNKINIKKFTLKAMLYIVFLWWGYYALLSIIPLPAVGLIFLICLNEKMYEIINNNFDIFLLIPIFSPFACYILAKLFGIFKFINNLKTNMLLKLFLLTILATFSFFILLIRFVYVYDYEAFGVLVAASIFCVIPEFFLYKYFQYLTKKHPKPFEKIGYYSSIQFWKDMINKIKSSIN